MKIGMIAMSGVRVVDPHLIELGLNLPGFVERSKVIASLPSLGLLTLAGMTPAEFDVEYHEVADFAGTEAMPGPFDLVAISTFTAQAPEAYRLADRYRAAGVPVVLGGLHASALPGEVLEHATAVAAGEGELLWPRMLEDWRAGRLGGIYRPEPGERFDFTHAPMPRFDLLDPGRYNRITVQTSRGCPHKCEFCASSILLEPRYKAKPWEKVIEEIRAIKRIWPKPFIEFADDNSFVHRNESHKLLEALIAEDITWFTEADISIARNAKLLELMQRSGCRQVLIGLETPGGGVGGIELRRDWKRGRQPNYEAAIETIQRAGITVNGCFILGLDGDTEETFEEIYQFIERTNLYEAQLTVLTPLPGTPLYTRLLREGRLLEPGAWEKCTLFDVNYRPQSMSPQRLREGLYDLTARVYDPGFVKRRREQFFRALRGRETVVALN